MTLLPRNARTGTIAVFVAAITAFGGGGALAASAGKSVIPRTEAQAQAQLTSLGSAVARCPAGKMVSGGFTAPGFSKEGLPTVRVGSAAVGRREWRIDALFFGDDDDGTQGGPAPAPPTGTIVAHAYCAPAPGRIKVREASAQVPLGSLGSVTARCNRGRRAIAGGFASPDLDQAAGRGVLALSSFKTGKRGWTVEGVNANDGDPQQGTSGTLTAIVYCSKAAPRLIERSQQASVGNEQYRSFDVSCPAGTKAVSGGFDGNVGPLGENLTAAGAVESYRMRKGAGWTTSAVSIDETVGATVTGLVYCAPKPS